MDKLYFIDKATLAPRFIAGQIEISGEGIVSHSTENFIVNDMELTFHDFYVYVNGEIDENLSSEWRKYVLAYLNKMDREIEKDMGVTSIMAECYCKVFNCLIEEKLTKKLAQFKALEQEIATLKKERLSDC